MKRSWTLNWDPSRIPPFSGLSDDGSEVIFQSTEGLVSFLNSGNVSADAISRVLRELHSPAAGFKTRVELLDSWK